MATLGTTPPQTQEAPPTPPHHIPCPHAHPSQPLYLQWISGRLFLNEQFSVIRVGPSVGLSVKFILPVQSFTF